MSRSRADLRIRVTCHDRVILTLIHDKNERRFPTDLPAETLQEYRNGFYQGLDGFWRNVGEGLKVDLDTAAQALANLHSLGRRLNFQLFGERRHTLEQYLRRLFPGFEGAGSGGYRPPILEVTTLPEHLLPFEFLPWFDTTPPPPMQTARDLMRVAACFPGFSMIINRVLLYPRDKKSAPRSLTSSLLDNEKGLRVRFFQHAGLWGAVEERKYLSSRDGIDLQGAWPDQLLDPAQFVSDLAKHLMEAGTVPAEPHGRDHIHHFACHCNTEAKAAGDYALFLAHKKHWWSERRYERRASISALQSQFGGFAERHLSDDCPLVVLNACGASKLTPAGVSSFPDLFLKIRSRGVIGTETTIPDEFATAFAKQFYDNLLRGYKVGETMYRARWHLLAEHYNPLGILYAAYVDPELGVWKPVSAIANERASAATGGNHPE